MRKITLLFIVVATIHSNLFAQTISYNPFVENVHFAPQPSPNGFEFGTVTELVFTMGLNTPNDGMNFTTQPLGVSICTGGFAFASNNIDSIVSGSYASNFLWEIDSFASSCVIGTQKQVIPGTGNDPLNVNPLASGEIRIKVKVPENAAINAVMGANINLTMPGYMNGTNSVLDDNGSAFTTSYGDLQISGKVYFDHNLADATIYAANNFSIGQLDSTSLYVNLVDNSTGLVVATKTVNSDGSYKFMPVNYNVIFTPINYSVSLSTFPGTIGSAPPSTVLPLPWVNTGESPSNLSGSDGNTDGVVTFSITNFSRLNADFGVQKPGVVGPLPVSFKNFYALQQNCSGVLSWATLSEENFSHTEILRRKGIEVFQKIATMHGAGGVHQEHVYTYYDESVDNDVEYEYQLKFVDVDGKYVNSQIVRITYNCNAGSNYFQLFPNPVETDCSVLYVSEIEDVLLEMNVVDASGKKVLGYSHNIVKGNNVLPLSTSHLAPGQYTIQYRILDKAEEGSIKFIKK